MQPVQKTSVLLLGMSMIMVACNSTTTTVTPAATVPSINLNYLSLGQGIPLANNAKVAVVPNPTFRAKATPAGSNTIAEFKYQIGDGALVDIQNNNLFVVPLNATGEYELKLFAKDSKGLSSNPYKVTLFVDASPATVNFATPTEGQTINGKAVKFSIAAEDLDTGIAQVVLKDPQGTVLSNCKPVVTGNKATVDCTVDVSGYADGAAAFTVEVTNRVGATSTKTINTMVKNNPDEVPPTVKINKIDNLLTDALGGKTFSGTIQVDVDAQDINGVKSVELLVNGNPLPAKTSTPFIFSVNTTDYDNGPLVISAKATNTLNKTAVANSVTINIDNVIPPLFVIASPTNNAQVSGSQSVKVLLTRRNSNFDVLTDSIKVDFYDYRGDLVATRTITGVKDGVNGDYDTLPFDFSGLIDDWYTLRATAQVNVLKADGSVANATPLNLTSEVRVTATTASNNPPAVVILTPVRLVADQSFLPSFVNTLKGNVLVQLSDDKGLASAELRMTCDDCVGGGPQNALMEHKNLSNTSSTVALFRFDYNGTPYLPNGTYTLRIKAEDNEGKSNIQEVKVKIDRTLDAILNSFTTTTAKAPDGVKQKFAPYSGTYNPIGTSDNSHTYMVFYYFINPNNQLFYSQAQVVGNAVMGTGYTVVFNLAGTWTFGGQIQDMTTGQIYPLNQTFVNVVSAE
ncbi:Ig-like domain-containing protein [Deinococcus misasensis]|uniref:Ig-like domain-containing protein n=1 Tax=Deinococcus misasensis TaxID=392413 RepID=UPI00055226CC|nr:Ig-like domain-containing protein [Deinococcus misasensis]